MGFIKELYLNRHPGQYAFSMHRVTGVVLTIYLLLHITLHSTALLFGPDIYDKVLLTLENPFGRLLELLTMLAVVIHMSNGLRLLLIDFFDMARGHRRLAFLAVSFTVIFMGYAVWVIL
ncbi:MAG: sdhC [Deltaproteobacteria bacterium]|nr:sdhC [Deltaproteobacteria bacterium]